jgi:tetratricopeptide (TPR) repeat protein
MLKTRITLAMAAALTVSCVHDRRAVVSTPAAPSVWDRQIRNARDAGDGDYPLKTLRDRVAAEPDNVAVRLELAKAYRELGYPEIAVEVCRLAAARFPESAKAQLELVRSLYEMKRPAEAIAALEARPRESSEYYSWMGILRDSTGSWTTGEAAHRKAVELAPAQDALHNNLGYNLLMQKKSEEAAAEFREALRLNPGSQTARNNLGTALATSNTQQALASWRAASDPATAHSNLAAVWIEKGNYAEARKELAVALGYNKSHPAALRNMELVARLDGQPAGMNAQPSESRWVRWKTGFKRLFVGPLEGSQAAPVKTASAN